MTTLAALINQAATWPAPASRRRLSDANEVRNPDARIMEVLIGLMGWARKCYVYPSRAKLCQLVQDFTGRRMSPRTLSRHTRSLERDQALRRLRRYGKSAAGEPQGRTTLYWPRGRWLARAQRVARGFAGWQRAAAQRTAQRLLTRAAANKQPPTAVVTGSAVDNPTGPPK
jgi:hypothetical protein